MNKVLFIVNQFPPFGGGGVMRALKFVKYLPSFDWRPYVLTRDFSKYLVYKDESLLDELPENIKIQRVPSLEPLGLVNSLKKINNNELYSNKNNPVSLIYYTLKKLRDFIYKTFLIPDKDILWVIKARKKAEEILLTENIDTVLTTSPPNSTHLIGYYIKKKYPEIKWIADFRDVWNVDSCKVEERFWLHKKIYRNEELKILQKADKVIVVCNLIKDKTLKYFGKEFDSKIQVIPNGYDENDFVSLNDRYKDNSFTLTYAGSLLDYRKNQKLMEGIKLIKENGKLNDIKVNLIGAFNEQILNKIDKYNLNGIVNYLDFKPHREALNILNNSDVLLFVLLNIKQDEMAPAGKLFELIRIGKPLLALVPEGVAKQSIKTLNAGITVDPDNPEEIYRGIIELHKNYEKYKNSITKDEIYLKRFERKELTRNLSKLLNDLSGN